MKPSDVFGIVVRTVGLLLVLAAAASLFVAILGALDGGQHSAAGLAASGFPTLLVGLWLLRGAPLLVWFAYPDAFKKTRTTAPIEAAHRDAALNA
jgi:hypothetical protein